MLSTNAKPFSNNLIVNIIVNIIELSQAKNKKTERLNPKYCLDARYIRITEDNDKSNSC